MAQHPTSRHSRHTHSSRSSSRRSTAVHQTIFTAGTTVMRLLLLRSPTLGWRNCTVSGNSLTQLPRMTLRGTDPTPVTRNVPQTRCAQVRPVLLNISHFIVGRIRLIMGLCEQLILGLCTQQACTRFSKCKAQASNACHDVGATSGLAWFTTAVLLFCQAVFGFARDVYMAAFGTAILCLS